MNQLKNNNDIDIINIRAKPNYFKIAKFIYDIKPFKSENGFFFLVTQYPIRPINMNIIYKINYNNLNYINNNFSEGLLISLRDKKKEILIEKENNNCYLYNKRFLYFINKIYKGQNDLVDDNKDKMEIEEINNNNIDETMENKNDDIMNVNSIEYKKKEKESLMENDKIKSELILFFRKKLKKSTNPDDYLNNKNYKCEFCEEVFKEYNKESMFYKCVNNDISFSCCITFKPINDNFLWCNYCNLFYSEEIKIYYCIVCERILAKLDFLS